MWHHNQVIKCLAAATEHRLKEINSQKKVSARVIRQVDIVREGEKATSVALSIYLDRRCIGNEG